MRLDPRLELLDEGCLFVDDVTTEPRLGDQDVPSCVHQQLVGRRGWGSRTTVICWHAGVREAMYMTRIRLTTEFTLAIAPADIS